MKANSFWNTSRVSFGNITFLSLSQSANDPLPNLLIFRGSSTSTREVDRKEFSSIISKFDKSVSNSILFNAPQLQNASFPNLLSLLGNFMYLIYAYNHKIHIFWYILIDNMEGKLMLWDYSNFKKRLLWYFWVMMENKCNSTFGHNIVHNR